MTQGNMPLNRKKERLKINSIDEFKDALKREGYNINEIDEEKFKEKVTKTFSIDSNVTERLHRCINNSEITYRANDIRGFIDYIEKIILFEKEHNKLCEKISEINKLYIDRIEYQREVSSQDNVEDIIKAVEEIKSHVSSTITEEEKARLEALEKEIDEDYLYAKDIELLKKMILSRKETLKEKYNDKTKIKTISIEVPKQIDYQYIPAKRGSVEYHQHISNNIPRMQRLIKNMNKYMKSCGKEKTTFKINQSKALQDSINIAVAIFDNKEFKAISGSNNISNYCMAPPLEKAVFKSSKVNKLGKLGVGYNRVNDSEKKIFEEIHKQIEVKALKNEGNLILYSKWEPCPSCYSVISQFCKKYPDIKVKVKYSKKYGE
ncbi:MAG: deaminase domain-containing protein [Clostridium septicum]|uniref:deaminase domain-containing protein n=1 Tax=Clostridium septicum TaxID=1504 RepID=UPI002584AB60|nr:deaminase domain-containing protein [Clostridium septicum]MDU1313134.1 deaminase domain-containing protein [Clostridium septicum]